MTPFWRIFISVFCYVAAVVGLGLAVINASHKPASTPQAIVFGVAGVLFGVGGVYLSRRPRY
jgi:hypothetical protein